MATYPNSKGTAIANTIFGTTAVAAESLANQVIESFSVNLTSEKLEIKGNNGAVVGVWYFNQTSNGTFSVLKLSTGGITTDEVSETMTIPISGSNAVVIIDQISENRVQNDVVKQTFNWTYYPAVTL
jgi:hypothetical protein